MARGYRRAVYQIGITADVTEFQRALNQALESLNKLGQKPVLVGELQQASAAALDLATNLRTAVNQNTGKLDLTTFSKNLDQSGRSLEQYRNMLMMLGPSGREAFLQVAQAVTKAEMPLIRSNKLLSDLWITIKNTMRWQLTNTVLHGFIGGLQTAYGYSKSLDASLNSIRIVTKQSTEDMADFAEQANKAAKALSTTTTDYTDASLIYYQQGLNNEEVQKRTETTIKMANAANESAEIVSQQLTAVWNNFYDGSKSLEYYADVMVALGASTASSSDEIAQGIQKFASVAETVGLSYEYGAAALATLTANTRESADVVGNSLKTLFSRIQGLQLGETLEDGTDLNKYSKALDAIGVSIKDANNELKDMDVILDETAARWGSLTRDQQMALAQTVAGVRQYTQFISLMENWGDFQENLNTALTSTGALQEQADIYASSWEAARKRVKAAAEDIYDSLINPDFYINVDDILTPFLSSTAKVIDAMGGMKGVLTTLGILMTSVYGDKIAQSMRDMAVTLGFMTGEEQKRAVALQQRAAQLAQATIYETTESEAIRMKVDAQKQFIDLQGQAAEHMSRLNPLQQENLRMDLEHVQNLYKQVDAFSEVSAKSQEMAETYRNNIMDIISGNDELLTKIKQVGKEVNETMGKLRYGDKNIKINVDTKSAKVAINSLLDNLENVSFKAKGIEIIKAQLQSIGGIAKGVTPEIVKLAQEFGLLGQGVDINSDNVRRFFTELEKGTGDASKIESSIKAITQALQDLGVKQNDIVRFTGNYKKYQANLEATKVATDELGNSIDNIKNKFYTMQYQQLSVADAIVRTSNQFMRLGMMIQSIKTLGNIWNDDDISTGDKLIQTLTSLGMIVPTVVSVFQLLNKTGVTYKTVWMAGNEETVRAIVQSKLLGRQKIVESAEIEGNTKVVIANTTAWYANPVFWIASIIIGVVAAIAVYNTVLEENTKRIRENAKEEAESAQKLADETKKEREEVNNLYKEYISLKANLDGSSDAKEALKEHTEKLCKALGVEWSALDKLQDKYEEVNKQIALASRDALLDDIQKTQTAMEDTKTSILESGSNYIEPSNYKVSFDAGFATFDEQEINSIFEQALKDINIDNIIKAGTLDSYGETISNNFDFIIKNSEEFIKAYEAISDAIQQIREDTSLETARNGSEIFQAAKEWVAEYASEYDKIIGYQQDLIKYAEQLAEAEAAIAGADLASIDTLEEYQQIKDQYIQQLQETFKDLELITPEMNDEYFEDLAEQYLAGYAHLADEILADQTLREILEKVGAENEELIRQFIEDNQYKINILATIDWDVLSNEDNLENAIKDAYNNIKDKIQAQEFKAVIPVIISTMSDLEEGKELKDDQIKQLQALEEEYSKLGAIRDRYSAQYIQALRDIREGMEGTISRDALKDLNEAWDELKGVAKGVVDELDGTVSDAKASYKALKDIFGEKIDLVIDLDSDEAMDQLEAIMDADYAVQVAIEADLESDINDVLDYASKIQEATGLIQEGFRIAYDDAETLQSVFPGILSGYTVLADGMIQLDREIAEQHLNLATTQVEADKEACRQNILDYKQVLLSKAEAMRTIAEGLQALATTDKNESEKVAEAKAQIENGVTKFKDACAQEQAMISENLADSEVNDSNQVLGANNNAATQSSNNWAGAYESMAQNSGRWAQIAIKNANAVAMAMKAAAEGEVISPEATMGGIFNRFSGGFEEAAYSGTYESAGVTEKSWEDYYQAGDYQSAYEEAIKQAEAYESAASNLDVFLTKLDGAVETAKNLVDTAGTGKSKSGGKKKGSSGKEKDNTGKVLDPEEYMDPKELDDIKERYHEITREIKRQADLLDDINHNTERAYGVNKIRSYKKELVALTKQLENQNSKLAEAQAYLVGDKAAVSEIFPQAIFNEKGEISNYTSLLQDNYNTYTAVVAKYNEFIDSYNEYRAIYSTWTKDEQEAAEEELKSWENMKDEAKKAVEEAEDAYQKRIDVLKQYEETLDVIQEVRDEIEQLQRDIDDNRLNQIEYRLEIVLEIKNMKDLVSKLTKEIAESFGDAITHGLKVAEISAEDARREAALYPEYKKQYDALVNEYENADDQADRDRIIKDIENLQEKVVASGEALLEWIETLDDLLPNAINDARKRFEHFTNWLDHNVTILDTIKELYALQGMTYKTQEGFDRLQKASAEKMEALTNKAALNRSWYEHASEQVEIARAKLESLGGNEQDVRWDIYKANYDALLKEQHEAQEAMLEAAKEALEVAQEMATLSLERTMYELEQQLTKGLGFDLLQDKYDHYIETEERYFDKVNEAYQVGAWYSKLQADIDKTTNKAMRDRLKALQEEIDTRREGNKLSQYDLDILEAKYKVLQAQMALEDAQNAKNNMKLVRDRQGNWNYQFVADPDEVDNAEQGIIDAENEWYNIAKDRVKEISGEIITTQKEMWDALKELEQEYIDSGEERDENYWARREEIVDYYTGKIKYLEEEKNIAIADMTEAGNQSLLHMAILYGDEVSDLTGLTSEDIKTIISATGSSIKEFLIQDLDGMKKILFSDSEVIKKLFNSDSEGIKKLLIANADEVMKTLLQDKEMLKELLGTNSKLMNDIISNSSKAIKDLILQDTGLLKELTEIDSGIIDSLMKDNANSIDFFDNVFAKDLDDMTISAEEFEKSLDEALEKCDENWEKYRDTMDEVTDKTGTNLDELDRYVDDVAESNEWLYETGMEAVDALWEQLDATREAAEGYAELAEQIMGVIEQLRELAQAQVEYVEAKADLDNEDWEPDTPNNNKNYHTDYAKEIIDEYKANGGMMSQKIQDLLKEREEKIQNLGANGAMSNEYFTNIIQAAIAGNSAAMDLVYGNDYFTSALENELLKKYKGKYFTIGFDTGGYTGEFDDAKLAFLHEKELVLNQEDTKNILSAVSTVRDLGPNLFASLEKIIDGNAVAAMSLLANNVPDSSQTDIPSTTIEQKVSIEHVEFPNVTSHDEILQAFEGLTNDAAQWAQRRKS